MSTNDNHCSLAFLTPFSRLKSENSESEHRAIALLVSSKITRTFYAKQRDDCKAETKVLLSR